MNIIKSLFFGLCPKKNEKKFLSEKCYLTGKNYISLKLNINTNDISSKNILLKTFYYKGNLTRMGGGKGKTKEKKFYLIDKQSLIYLIPNKLIDNQKDIINVLLNTSYKLNIKTKIFLIKIV